MSFNSYQQCPKKHLLLRLLELDSLSESWQRALTNKLRLETKTRLLAPFQKKREIIKKAKTARRVSFGNVTVNKIHKKEIHDNYESSKKGKVKSAEFIEKHILTLLIYISPKDWDASEFACSNYNSLVFHLVHENLSLEIFMQDMRKIYSDLVKSELSVLGYKGSWTFKKYQPKQEYHNHMWINTGLQINVLPNLKLYLLKIMQDRQFASTLIQKNWRKHRELMLYTTMNKLKKFLLSFCNNLN